MSSGMEDMATQVADLLKKAEAATGAAGSLEALQAVQASYLGRQGALNEILRGIGRLPPEQRGQVGQLANRAKKQVEECFAARRAELEQAAANAEKQRAAQYDPTIPARREGLGSLHPVTIVQQQIEEVFGRLGFIVATGPEMESEYYNFEALNIPPMHPARDMQDTFWLGNGKVLRTQTSAVQVRAMEKYGAPLRIIAPGRCFRYEAIDPSHENTFFQLEGLMIDRNISIANLIAVMKLLLTEVFQREVEIRLRPGYFPFVEPGFELDIRCEICGGTGCPTCKQSGWIEILPCGMVHPNVLKYGGIDPLEYTGFAFGLGLTRLAMMKYGIRDIRVMNSGDLRALVPAEKLTGPTIAAVT
jgi:phenylalanyl-tRNA synthetase alpha chain